MGGVFANNDFGAKVNLNKISKWLKNPNASEESKMWNYGRYCTITLASTGVNNAGLCGGKELTLGDTSLTKGADYNTLKSEDGSRHIPANPILESVRISNDMAQDVSDSALYEIEVSFKCFSYTQFAEYEEAFFKTGNEVNIVFGYKGLAMGGKLTSNVYNFGFSLDASGVYACNMKLTGRNKFAGVLQMNQELPYEGTTVKDEAGNETTANTIMSELDAKFMEAFPDFEDSSGIDFGIESDQVDDGKAVAKDGFAVANIQTHSGMEIRIPIIAVRLDLDDMYVKYVTYEKLLEIITKAHGSSTVWEHGTKGQSPGDIAASADPSLLQLGGKASYYGEGDPSILNTNASSGNDFSDIPASNGIASGFYLSMAWLRDIIGDLEGEKIKDKEAGAGATSVNNFLRVVNGGIKDITGGLYDLQVYNQGYTQGDSNVFQVVNYKAEHDPKIKGGYDFKLHTIGSTLRSVSMTSNFDADMAAVALVSDRGGKIPSGALKNLYGAGCVPTKNTAGKKDNTTAEDLKEKRAAIGKGFSADRVQDYKAALNSYIQDNLKTFNAERGYRYSIDLTVTHYGCWGTQIGNCFTFAGVPPKYKGNGKYFVVGGIQHSFDGQGGWETEVTGFLKLEAV